MFEDHSESKFASLYQKDKIAVAKAAEAAQRQREKEEEQAARQARQQEELQNSLENLGTAIANAIYIKGDK